MLRTRSNFLLGAAALGGLVLSVNPAAAQSVPDGVLEVQATVGELCTVTSASLNFGEYAGTPITQTGGITIECVAETDVTIALDGGQDGNGNGLRTMQNGPNQLVYGLYKDAGFGQTWETDGVVTKTITTASTVPVYGQINPTQNPGTLVDGVYTDQVNITLSF